MKKTLVEKSDGQLAATFREAMRMNDQMKADGVSPEERELFIAKALREAWPKGREEPWHYECRWCDDTGWQPKTCIRGSCGRPFRLPQQASDDYTGRGRCQEGHRYVLPCSCSKGESFRRQLMKAPRPLEDAVEKAARSSKPTKVGR